MAEYKLSYTGNEINEKLGKIDSVETEIGKVQTFMSELFSLIYPVGSIYMSTNTENPSIYFGGTWVAWGSGRVPVGVNTNDSNFSSVEKTGGESSHALTTTEVASHTHTVGAHDHGFTPSGTLSTDNHKHVNVGLRHNQTGYDYEIPANTGYLVWGDAMKWNGSTPMKGNKGVGGYTDELEHTHTFTGKAGTTSKSSAFNSGASGSGTAHNNLQPYITCYMWKRVA